MFVEYYDKNGTLVKKGDIIQHLNGDIKKVVTCDNEFYIDADDDVMIYQITDFSESFENKEWEIIGNMNDVKESEIESRSQMVENILNIAYALDCISYFF